MIKSFKIIIILNFIYNFCLGQNPEPRTLIGVEGQDYPVFIIKYEIIPYSNSNCVFPVNTIIFELPTSEDFYENSRVNQEISSWYRVVNSNDNNFNLTGLQDNRWKLIIRGKRIISQNEDLKK